MYNRITRLRHAIEFKLNLCFSFSSFKFSGGIINHRLLIIGFDIGHCGMMYGRIIILARVLPLHHPFHLLSFPPLELAMIVAYKPKRTFVSGCTLGPPGICSYRYALDGLRIFGIICVSMFKIMACSRRKFHSSK